jgi:hypothetical protein
MRKDIDIIDKAREIPRGIGGYHHDIVQEMIAEIERLRAERDEARREILLLLNGCCSWSKLTQEIKKRGWECLKEDGK